MSQLYNLLRGTCFYCHSLLLPRAVVSANQSQRDLKWSDPNLKIARYTAKLILLEHGFPLEAEQVDKLLIHGGKKKTSQRGGGDGDHMDVDAHSTHEEETAEDYKRRLFSWVAVCLRRAGGSTTRDNYKTATCFDKRRQVINEFLKILRGRKCATCGACVHPSNVVSVESCQS
jgi:DNA-directed RNA polymerase I subunit RPA1